MKRIVRSAIIFNVIIVILAVVLTLIDPDNLIISVGIIFANYILIGGWILLGVLFVLGNLVSFLRWRREKRNQDIAAARAMSIERSSKETLNPKVLREELEHFYKQRPALQEQITAAIAQLDSMDRKQAKLREIFERNHVKTLDEVEATVNDAEQVLCRNMAKLINRIILWDPLEWNKPGKEKIYESHRVYMKKLLDQCEEILSKCDILLAETVSYLDEKDAGLDSDKLHLDVMTETIQLLSNIKSVEL